MSNSNFFFHVIHLLTIGYKIPVVNHSFYFNFYLFIYFILRMKPIRLLLIRNYARFTKGTISSVTCTNQTWNSFTETEQQVNDITHTFNMREAIAHLNPVMSKALQSSITYMAILWIASVVVMDHVYNNLSVTFKDNLLNYRIRIISAAKVIDLPHASASTNSTGFGNGIRNLLNL